MKDEPTWSYLYTAKGAWMILPQGECFQDSEAFCKEGNVRILEEPLTGNEGYLVMPFALSTLVTVGAG